MGNKNEVLEFTTSLQQISRDQRKALDENLHWRVKSLLISRNNSYVTFCETKCTQIRLYWPRPAPSCSEMALTYPTETQNNHRMYVYLNIPWDKLSSCGVKKFVLRMEN